MKILVPTDFSIYAHHAMEMAQFIATSMDGEIHFYHSANVPDDWEDLSAEERHLDEVNKKVAIRSGKRLDQLIQECENKSIKCFGHFTGGKFIDNIHEVLDKHSFDLIVMGSHGVSSKEEWFIGSNTQKVVRRLHIPTLVVKRKPLDVHFKEVVFTSEMLKRDEESFRHFLAFLAPFKPDIIHLLMINTGSFFNQPSILTKESIKEFEQIAAGYNCQSHFYTDYSVEAGIRHFTEEQKLDLVGISSLYSNKIKRIFQGSIVEMLVNHSEAPVYVIDYD